MANIVSAVFADHDSAQRAVDWLRDSGVNDNAISLVRRGEDRDTGTSEKAEDAGKGAAIGAGVGAGVGALFGLAAVAIPGIGPFITAGALAEALGVWGGGAAAGAIVGGVSGGLAAGLAEWGLTEEEAKYYAGEVERGGTYVGVDLDRTTIDRATVEAAFRRYNGRIYGTTV